MKEGKLKQKEDVAIGLENAPATIVRLFTGENFGKQLLKIADPPLNVWIKVRARRLNRYLAFT